MQYLFNESVRQMKASSVREILKLTQGGSVISFAGGLPAEELFPAEAIREAAQRIFALGNGALQYGLTEGYVTLREQIGERLAAAEQVKAGVDETILTTGSQQAIDLLARVYLEPGDTVLVENPTYLACLQALRFRGARIVPVVSDADGMDPGDLADKIKRFSPKMAYVVPTFSNPAGKVWSLERRKELLRQCKANNILIVEDDPYGEISFGDYEPVPTLLSLDGQPEDSAVVYTSTFSKTVAPALRTGWAIGDRRVIQMMARAKQSTDLHSSMIDQQILSELLRLEHFKLDDHIAKIRHEYEERMKVMAGLLRQDVWQDARWIEPKGGMFIWVELPEGLDAEALLRASVPKGVAFVPGTDFYAAEPKRNTMRLNFTHSSREQLARGMNLLSEAVEEFTARS
ncbi:MULTISPECIES: PLP-dependent aminotransferase family protein [unclassified Paenibacillus]|uniref:aminotransferase-like domain-containing protein n=1 Tax=unclassified Paenibacillus TaxID=185978 RepID=UPI001C10BDA4|nr:MULTISPECIES: PLP-dependent aminotransferase family protein [unclassified Paenibacillus]MBU5442759.1 PLP-dependent aminotransferase family protein [Paenibacillus sp. MSJ-34]CAH0117832.1 2-aminoadipate transaminase [Paenibacillus sp. CECT 9249]